MNYSFSVLIRGHWSEPVTVSTEHFIQNIQVDFFLFRAKKRYDFPSIHHMNIHSRIHGSTRTTHLPCRYLRKQDAV